MIKSFKKTFLFSVLFLSALFFVQTVHAASYYDTEVEYGVNFRDKASTNSKVIRMLSRGEDIRVIEETNKYWLKIETKDGRVGYISSNKKYTDYDPNKRPSVQKETVETTGYPWFRSAPSTSSKIYRSVPKGTKLEVLEKTNAYYVKVSFDGRVGYVSTKYVKTVGDVKEEQKPVQKTPAEQKADDVIATAKFLMGKVTYKYGVRDTKNLIFDCSSFTQYVFGKRDIDFKWGTRFQKDAGTHVDRSDLKKGDLVFFTVGSGKQIGHVGIYLGDGTMIHNNNSGNVHISDITDGYWGDRYVTARRVIH